jgi:putative DNA primase/helicase
MRIMFPPMPSVKLMKIATGVGKSREAREQIKQILPSLPPGTCVVILTPTHNLNDEHLERLVALLKGVGADVAVYRGRNALDPARPGKKMCDFSSEASKLTAAGGNKEQLCSRKKKGKLVSCKFHDECGYRKQFDLTPQVWIIPHALLTKKLPSCIPEIGALIIDEDPLQSFLGGFDANNPVRVSMDELQQVRRVPFKQGSKIIDDEATADLETSRAALCRALSGVDGIITTKSLIDAGLTAKMATDAHKAILKSKKRITVSPDMPTTERQKRIKEATIHNGPILRLSRLWLLIGAALEVEYDVLPGCRVERGIKTKNGPQYDAIRLRWRDPLHNDWKAPSMILSATAEPALLQHIWPQLEVVADVNPVIPHTKVTQISWSASKLKLENENNLRRIKHFAEVAAFKHRGNGVAIGGRQVDMLLVAQKAAKENLIALSLPDNIDTAHFNAVEGIDKWGEIAIQATVGRTMPPPHEVELMAEVLTGKVANRHGAEFPGGWYPRKFMGIRIKGAGEVGHPTLMEYHPDTLCEAIRRCICEGGLIQANGRPRAVNRTEANPLHIIYIGNIPLPWEVDEVLPADAIDPDPYWLMAARGLLPAPSATKGKHQIVQKVLPDLFPTEDAARKALNRTNANIYTILEDVRLSAFVHADVKISGYRYKIAVLIDPSQGDPRETAERLLGPLDSFECLNEPPPAPARDIRITPADFGLVASPRVERIPPSNLLSITNGPTISTSEAYGKGYVTTSDGRVGPVGGPLRQVHRPPEPEPLISLHDARKPLGIGRVKFGQITKRHRHLSGKDKEKAIIEAMIKAAGPEKAKAFVRSLGQ